MTLMFGKYKDSGLWFSKTKALRLICRDGRLFVALGGVRIRLKWRAEA